MATITIELPDDVAKSAQQAGILSGQTLAISSVRPKSGRVDVVTRPSCHQSRRVLPSMP